MRPFAALARLEASFYAPHAWERFVVHLLWRWAALWPWLAPCLCGNEKPSMVREMVRFIDGHQEEQWRVECPCGRGEHQVARTERLMRGAWFISCRSARRWRKQQQERMDRVESGR